MTCCMPPSCVSVLLRSSCRNSNDWTPATMVCFSRAPVPDQPQDLILYSTCARTKQNTYYEAMSTTHSSFWKSVLWWLVRLPSRAAEPELVLMLAVVHS